MVSGLSLLFEEERIKAQREAEEKVYKDKLKVIKNLIKIGLSNNQISEAMDIIEEEVDKLRKS